MEDFFRKAVQFGLGIWDFTREKVEAVVEEMIRRGELSQQEKSGAVNQILEKARAEQEALTDRINRAVSEALAGMGLARAADLEALEKRVAALEERLKEKTA